MAPLSFNRIIGRKPAPKGQKRAGEPLESDSKKVKTTASVKPPTTLHKRTAGPPPAPVAGRGQKRTGAAADLETDKSTKKHTTPADTEAVEAALSKRIRNFITDWGKSHSRRKPLFKDMREAGMEPTQSIIELYEKQTMLFVRNYPGGKPTFKEMRQNGQEPTRAMLVEAQKNKDAKNAAAEAKREKEAADAKTKKEKDAAEAKAKKEKNAADFLAKRKRDLEAAEAKRQKEAADLRARRENTADLKAKQADVDAKKKLDAADFLAIQTSPENKKKVEAKEKANFNVIKPTAPVRALNPIPYEKMNPFQRKTENDRKKAAKTAGKPEKPEAVAKRKEEAAKKSEKAAASKRKYARKPKEVSADEAIEAKAWEEIDFGDGFSDDEKSKTAKKPSGVKKVAGVRHATKAKANKDKSTRSVLPTPDLMPSHQLEEEEDGMTGEELEAALEPFREMDEVEIEEFQPEEEKRAVTPPPQPEHVWTLEQQVYLEAEFAEIGQREAEFAKMMGIQPPKPQPKFTENGEQYWEDDWSEEE